MCKLSNTDNLEEEKAFTSINQGKHMMYNNICFPSLYNEPVPVGSKCSSQPAERLPYGILVSSNSNGHCVIHVGCSKAEGLIDAFS